MDWLPPERVTLEWRRACYREAREIVSVWHIRQQLTRRKRAREWR